ncbi:MAG: hypothetical protein IPK60_20510 [Sandaracinaceae bacterium]|nr:hypothetical protein [Sandaracinaceae bacterium]
MRYSQSLARSAKLSLAFSTTVAVLGSSAFAQILTTNDDTLTTYRAGVTAVQGLRPRPEQRGVNHDGSMRKASTHRLAVAGNPFERVWDGEAELNGVRLDTGTWTTSDVDISLPASSPWVIGRSYNARQDNSGHLASNGYQGFNWAQSSQPEIVLYEHASDDAQDVLYLVYGADRYAEFKRASSTANTYKGTNGAAGVFERTDASPDTWAYYAPDGTVATFFGFDTADADHKGQIWKVADPAGNVAYVGSTSSASAALSAGYDASGRITDAYDSAGRHFDYAYTGSAIGGVTRLESVIVTSGATEVARVEYDTTAHRSLRRGR